MAASCRFSWPIAIGISPRRRLFHHPLRLLTTTSRPPRPLRFPPKLSSSPEPPELDVAAADEAKQEEVDERYGFAMEVRKLPEQRNRRVVRARVRVEAPLEAVWATLTDYEALADFIPGLAECRLLERDPDASFARLYQVGEQDLALGFKFNAKGTIECYEGELELELEEVLPSNTIRRRREIAFNMVDGDFKLFKGKWSIQQQQQEVDGTTSDEGIQTTLCYVVELEPKLWVPVRLLQGRICKEIKTNLVCIREEAQRIHRLHLQGEQTEFVRS